MEDQWVPIHGPVNVAAWPGPLWASNTSEVRQGCQRWAESSIYNQTILKHHTRCWLLYKKATCLWDLPRCWWNAHGFNMNPSEIVCSSVLLQLHHLLLTWMIYGLWTLVPSIFGRVEPHRHTLRDLPAIGRSGFSVNDHKGDARCGWHETPMTY